jgi:hypothetical protein
MDHRATCLCLSFLPHSTPWCLVTDKEFRISPVQRFEGMKCDEGETPEAAKRGLNPHRLSRENMW